MTNMRDGPELPETKGITPARRTRLDPSRRRLLRGGLGAAPVLLTLASRPVLGTTATQCFTPSGFVSMPTSQHGTPTYCSGLTPGYWKTHSPWPSPYVYGSASTPHATLFKSYFMTGSLTPPDGNTWNTITFLDILSTPYQNVPSGAPFDIARLVVCSLLNIAQGYVPMTVLTPTVVQDIWNSYITTGYFEPTAGVKWYHDDIIAYICSTLESCSY